MSEIMIRCPIFGTAVRTGLRTEAIMFESLFDDLAIPLRCPACMKIHTWSRKNAWIDGSDEQNHDPVPVV